MTEMTVTIPGGLPADLDGFVALRDQLATTPQGGAAVYAVAQALWEKGAELGLQALVIATDRKYLEEGSGGYKGFTLRAMDRQAVKERIGGKPYLARSYFQGTSPENGYALPAGDLTVAIRQQSIDQVKDDGTKVFVHSTGADSPRPITLAKNNRGLWKALNWSSLQVGCRPPVQTVDDDL